MKKYTKILLTSTLLTILFSQNLIAKEGTVNTTAVKSMELKLANLEVSITEEKVKLFEREKSLHEMKVKSLHSTNIDQSKMALKLAEIRVELSKDELLLLQREVKLHEMEVALLQQ